MLPTVTIEGRTTDIPELRFTPNGAALAKFTLAANDRKKNEAGDWVDTDVLFIDVTCWRQLAENVAESVDKGDLVTVVGKLRTESWENKEGEKRSRISITAFSVAASLQFRTIKHGEGRAARSSGGTERDPWASGPPADEEPPF